MHQDARPAAVGDDVGLGLIGAAVAVTVWGSSGIVAKHVSLDGVVLAAYRFSFYAVLMIVVFGARGRVLSRHALRHSFWGGLCLALNVALFFSAVKLTSVANATVIGALQPLVVGLLAVWLLGETIRPGNVVAAVVAVVGVGMIVLESSSTDAWSIEGDLAALGALFAWSGYFVFSRLSQDHVSPVEYTTATAVYSGALNAVLAVAIGQDMSWPGGEDLVWVVLMALGAGVLGHSLMNWSLVRIPLWVGSTFTLLVPVIASVLAWLLLDEALTVLQGVGMAVVVGALAVIVRDQGQIERRRPPAAATS